MSRGTDANISRLVIFIEIPSLRGRALNNYRWAGPSIFAEGEAGMISMLSKIDQQLRTPDLWPRGLISDTLGQVP